MSFVRYLSLLVVLSVFLILILSIINEFAVFGVDKYSSRGVFDILVSVCCPTRVSEYQDSFSKFSNYHGNIYSVDTCPADIFLDWLSWDYIQNNRGLK